ncbi:hypothetical protein [Luteitalea sp.]
MRLSSFVRLAGAAAAFSLVLVAIPAHAQPSGQARLAPDVVAELVAAPDAAGARKRLAAHFLAVAAEYDAQARAHRAMAKSYRRAPTGAEQKRPIAPDTAAHCDRLADRAAGAATEARALATAYGGGASAVQVPAPATRDTAPSTSNPDDLLETTELRRLVEGTQTPESHARLERHYSALAAKLDRDAREHRDLAAAYRAAPTAAESKRPGAPDTAVHCERLAERVSRMAEDARELARRHGELRGDR